MQSYDDTFIAAETAKDTHLEEEDSVYESDENQSCSASVDTEVMDYTYENGRRYHAFSEGKYCFPNDQTEQDRLDMMHHIYAILSDGEVLFAPVGENVQRILDVGTGTGLWCIDAGDRYPSAEVIGTDLSPIQPNWVPPNVRFVVDDVESEWNFGLETFDVIHVRHLAGALENWEQMLKVCFEHIKPGGWIEVAEYEFGLKCDDGTYHEETAIWSYYQQVNTAAEKYGRPLQVAHTLGPLIQNAGFVDLVHMTRKLALGCWPKLQKHKEIGRWFQMVCQTGFEAFSVALLTRVEGKSIDEVKELLRAVEAEVASRSIHAYNMNHIYYAQKPE